MSVKKTIKQLVDYTKEDLMILYLETLLGTKKVITPIIKEKLLQIGFKLVVIGTNDKHEINSREIKTNFNGYDIAIGLAATAVSYGSGRKYSALVINLED